MGLRSFFTFIILNSPLGNDIEDIPKDGAPDPHKEELYPYREGGFGSKKRKDDARHEGEKPHEIIKNTHIQQFMKSLRHKATNSPKKAQKMRITRGFERSVLRIKN